MNNEHLIQKSNAIKWNTLKAPNTVLITYKSNKRIFTHANTGKQIEVINKNDININYRKEFSLENKTYDIHHKSWKEYYYDVILLDENALMFRIYRWSPLPIPVPQEIYEIFRIIVTAAGDCFCINRDESDVKPFTESMLWNPRSIFNQRMVKLNNNLPKTINKVKWENPFDGLYGCECSLKTFFDYIFKGHKKQWIQSNVPGFILDDLKIDKPSKPYKKTDDFLVFYTKGWTGFIGRMYITKGRTFFFKQNYVTKEFFSANISNFPFPGKGVTSLVPSNGIVNSEKKLYKLLEGTCMEGFKIDKDKDDILHYLEMQKRYLLIEQAAKTGLHQLSFSLLRDQDFLKQNKNKKLKDIFPVSIKRIKKILYLDSAIKYPSFRISALKHSYEYWNNILKDDIETAVFAAFVEAVILPDYFVYYRFEDNWVKYIKALKVRYRGDINELFCLCQYYRDYKNMTIELYRLENNFSHDVPYVRPSKIKKAHDDVAILLEKKKQALNDPKNINNAIRKRYTDDYKKYSFSSDEYEIVIPQNAEEIHQEGAVLHHCVGSYANLVARKETTILFLRKRDDTKTPFMTMEVKDKAICQFFGYHDRYNSDTTVSSFMESFAHEKDLLIKCPLLVS